MAFFADVITNMGNEYRATNSEGVTCIMIVFKRSGYICNMAGQPGHLGLLKTKKRVGFNPLKPFVMFLCGLLEWLRRLLCGDTNGNNGGCHRRDDDDDDRCHRRRC